MSSKKLDDLCEILSGNAFKSKEYVDEGIRVIRITNVQRGEIVDNDPKYMPYSTQELYSKYLLDEGDILISQTGNVGRVGKVPSQILPAFLNQRVAKISNKSPDELLDDYLFWVLNNEAFERDALYDSSGVAQKNLSMSWIKNYKIPLPSLDEQKAIVAKLDRAQRLIDIDKTMLEKYDELIQSVFLDMFGDPVTNPKGWEIKKLGDVGTLARGKSKHRPRNDPSILGGKYPLIQTGDVSNAGLFITDYDSTYNEQGLKQSKLWDKGTLCITIAANIAKVGILDFAACFPDSVVGFKSEQASSVFIYSWMGFLQDIIEEQAPVSAQKNINLRILRDLDIIFPPLELQKKYESAVLNIQIEINRVTEVNLKSEELFNSLVEGVFG